jgi:transcriptional regulator with XRE-family HTH domain
MTSDDSATAAMRRELGARLRALRADAGLTLGALARRIGSNTSSLSSLERGHGKRAPDRLIVKKFVEACVTELAVAPALQEAASVELLGVHAALTRVIEAESPRDAPVTGNPPSGVRLVRECDPRFLGIHKAIELDDAAQDLPRYVERDVDRAPGGLRETLLEAARRGGFVVLVGDSSVGKSRSAYEAVLDLFPEWPLVQPDPRDTTWLDPITDGTYTTVVVWLDELQRYFDNEHPLTVDGIRRALQLSGSVIFVGSLWADRFAEYIAPPRDGTSEDRWRLARDVLALGQSIRIAAEFSDSEQARARSAAEDDPRISVALQHPDYGLTQTIAAVPLLIDRWKNADPYASAVIEAAVDAGRLGVEDPIPANFLREAAPAYCPPKVRSRAPSGWFDAAIEYVTRPLHGAAAVLEPVAADMSTVIGYVVADYLLQEASRERRIRPVPSTTWQALAAHLTSPEDLTRCGHAAQNRLLYVHAVPLFFHAWCMRNASGSVALAKLMIKHGRADLGLDILRPFVTNGDGYATVEFFDVLRAEQRWDELRPWADAGDDLAATHIAYAWFEDGREDEAIMLLRLYFDAGRGGLANCLADLLKKRGRTDDALDVLRQGPLDNPRLAHLVAEQDNERELRHLIESGNASATTDLVQLLVRQDRVDDVATLAAQGDPYAAIHMIYHLSDNGRVDDALAMLEDLKNWSPPDGATNVTFTSHSVVIALAERLRPRLRGRQILDTIHEKQLLFDELSGGVQIVKSNALLEYGLVGLAPDVVRICSNEAEEIVEDGLSEDAIRELQAEAEGGHPYAGVVMSFLPLEEQRVKSLIPLIHERANAGNLAARTRLAELLLRFDTKTAWKMADDGDGVVINALVRKLTEMGQVDEAIRFVRGRVEEGDHFCALVHVDLLIEHERFEELRDLAVRGNRFAKARIRDLHVAPQMVVDADLAEMCTINDEISELQKELKRINDDLTSPTESERIDSLRRQAESGDSLASMRLADLLADLGHVNALRDLVAMGSPGAASKLIAALAKQGRTDEADHLDKFGLNDDGTPRQPPSEQDPDLDLS